MSVSFDEPTIPPRLRRPLAAIWISLGLHAAVIALVRVVPPAGVTAEAPVIEVRLASPRAAMPAIDTPPSPDAVPEPEVAPLARLAPGPAAEAPSVATPVAPSPPAASNIAEKPVATPAPAAEPAPQADGAPARAPAPEAALTSSVDLNYYTARELDVQPHALRIIRPDYPVEADRQKLSGSLRLQLKLEADGRVSDISVVSATPPGVFEQSAIKAFRDARFAPAQKNGRPVRSLIVIEVVYDWAGQAH